MEIENIRKSRLKMTRSTKNVLDKNERIKDKSKTKEVINEKSIRNMNNI